MTSKRVSPVNCSDSAITSQTSNGSNTSSTQRRLATVSPSTSPRSTSFYGSSPSNVTSGQYWAPVASRGSKFKTWSKGGYDKKGPQGSVQLTSTGTSTTPSNNMPLNPSQPNVPNSSQQSKPKRERPTTKSMSIQSFEAHQQKLEQINRSEQNPAPRATTPPFLHRDRRPRSQSTNSSTKSPKQTQFYRKKKPMLVDAVTQTSTDASTQTSEDDFELAMSLYRKSPYPETFQSISAPCSTPTTNTVSTQTNTFAVDPSILKVPAKERITATASMQRSLSTNTMNIQINLQEFEELQKQLTKFQQHKEALLSKSRPLSFTAVPAPTAVKINSVNITFPQAQIAVPQPQTPQPQVPIPQPLPQAHVVPIEVPQPPCVEEEEVEQLGPSQKLFSADAVLSDLEDLEEEIAFMRYKALSLQESVQWLQREKSSRPIAPGPPPPVEFTDSKTLAVNTPVKKVEPNKPEKRPNTPFDFMPDLQGPDQSKRQNIASQGSAFTTGASIGARLNKTRMSQSLTALPDLKM